MSSHGLKSLYSQQQNFNTHQHFGPQIRRRRRRRRSFSCPPALTRSFSPQSRSFSSDPFLNRQVPPTPERCQKKLRHHSPPNDGIALHELQNLPDGTQTRATTQLSQELLPIHFETPLLNSALWTRGKNRSDVLQRFAATYQSLWEESKLLAENGCVLIYAIPLVTRDGHRNRQWKACEIVFYHSGRWQRQELEHLLVDPVVGDSIFRCTLPVNASSSLFYIKDKHSEDRDHPGGTKPNLNSLLNLDSAHYRLGLSPITSLRDGDIAEGDRISSCGVCLKLKVRSGETEYWEGCRLRFLDEVRNEWLDSYFSENNNWLCSFLSLKSLSFVVEYHGKWLRSAQNHNFRIAFPGSYILYTDGQLFECSCPILNYRFAGGGGGWGETPEAVENHPQVFDIRTPSKNSEEGSCNGDIS